MQKIGNKIAGKAEHYKDRSKMQILSATLKNFDDIISLVTVAEKQDVRIDLVGDNNFIVSAKSLMGVIAASGMKSLNLIIYSDDRKIKDQLKSAFR